ncbi:MAG: hypothetical protein KC420_05045 [Myxococcales bacterium]|nr:hypothetical protein [Myxococcales bacterium]MCB9567272.1 hypothetical protein [Myxococcales bacterium]MCB9704323.1 hypothetical protein [Myxococcales bacterium]
MSIVGRLSGSLCKLALGTFCLGLVAGVACKPKYAPNEPVDGAPDACCRVANAEMTKFAGCRITHRCKNDEPIWMRGHIKCSPVEEGRCAGGRCCEYRPLYGSPDAVLFWDDGSGGEGKKEEAGGDAASEAAKTGEGAASEAAEAPAGDADESGGAGEPEGAEG